MNTLQLLSHIFIITTIAMARPLDNKIKITPETVGLVAYSCGNNAINKTTISLVTTPECNLEEEFISYETVNIVLSQTTKTLDINVHRCFGRYIHQLNRCGKTIDTAYKSGLYTELIEFDKDTCINLIENGVFYAYEHSRKISMPPHTKKYFTSFETIGSINLDGSCTPGTSQEINGIFYDRPIQRSSLELTFTIEKGFVDLKSGNLILPNGIQFNYLQKQSEHADYGYFFWELQKPHCEGPLQNSVTYKGQGQRIMSKNTDGTLESFIQANNSGYDFQIKINHQVDPLCGFETFSTEHTNTFVTLLPTRFTDFPLNRNTNSRDMDLNTYLTTKIIHTHRRTAHRKLKNCSICLRWKDVK